MLLNSMFRARRLLCLIRFLLLLPCCALSQNGAVPDSLYMKRIPQVRHEGKRELIYDSTCMPAAGIARFAGESALISNGDFTDYMTHSFSPLFPKTLSVGFIILLRPHEKPCCVRTDISYTTQTRPQSIALLKEAVLHYPYQGHISFRGQEQLLLPVLISSDANGKMKAILPGATDGNREQK